MANLGTKRDIQLNAFDIEREIELVVGWAIPEPGNHAQGLKAKLLDGSLQLANRLDRFLQVDRGNPNKAFRKLLNKGRNGIVADDPSAWSMPGTEHDPIHACLVHEVHQVFCTQILTQEVS